ncbi:MAG: ABC transporter permease [Acidobacteria bacterium]|nr:ABC transporter permease [Acidobacteriota bacterium]
MTRADLFGEAVRALDAHRLRASLSSIGIVFGVATIVAALAVADGARREAIDEIGALGIANVFVRAVRPADAPGDRTPAAPELTTADAGALRALPAVGATSSLRATRTEIANGGRHEAATLAGVEPGWQQIAEPQVAAGRWLVDADLAAARRAMVLGHGLARHLFGDSAPIGRRVQAGGNWWVVVGVLAPSVQASGRPSPVAALNRDEAAMVPLTAMDLSLGNGDRITRVSEIALASAPPEGVAQLAAAAGALMRRRHPDGGWELVVPRELLQARMRAERVFAGMLIGIGGLALFISGIGIMNIMLASVAERTQEIGVRRAFGARASEVVAQFAIEATLLAVGGGIVGVPTGVLLAALIAALAGWPIAVSAASVLLALGVAVGVGLLFGVYPARAAARIQPIDALRAP